MLTKDKRQLSKLERILLIYVMSAAFATIIILVNILLDDLTGWPGTGTGYVWMGLFVGYAARSFANE